VEASNTDMNLKTELAPFRMKILIPFNKIYVHKRGHGIEAEFIYHFIRLLVFLSSHQNHLCPRGHDS
jgi:hypothetical protein